MMGRRPCVNLTEARVRRMVDLIRRGVPQGAAAGAVGIPRRTLERWLAKGREQDAVEPYKSLADRLQVALDEFHASRAIIVAESRDDRTALEVLRRRFKDDWGDERSGTVINNNVMNVQVTDAAQELLSAARRVLSDSPDKFRELQEALLGGTIVDGEAVEIGDGVGS